MCVAYSAKYSFFLVSTLILKVISNLCCIYCISPSTLLSYSPPTTPFLSDFLFHFLFFISLAVCQPFPSIISPFPKPSLLTQSICNHRWQTLSFLVCPSHLSWQMPLSHCHNMCTSCSHLKGYYKMSWLEAPPPKKSDFVVIHIGRLMYHVKDSAERGLVFSKYRFFEFLGGSEIN